MAIGALDIAIVAIAFVLHSVSFASQYSGFVGWIARSEHVENGSTDFERVRVNVLSILGRTSAPFSLVAAMLLVSGTILVAAGYRLRTCSRGSP